MDSNKNRSSVCTAAVNILQQAKITACTLRPHPECAFFVAWNGVIVLVYEGFPPSLEGVKKCIDASLPGLKDENFGSKWPKTTLGAVNDAAGDLTLEDLQRLHGLCKEHSQKMAEAQIQVPIRSLSAVEYVSRGLEHLRSRIDVSLVDTALEDAMENSASLEQESRVDSVIQEWSDLPAYLPKVNAPGSRIGSYREESSADGGVTCVAFLGLTSPSETLPKHIVNFQDEIDKYFPGRYAWLDSKSWHCTLRSLDQKDDSRVKSN